MAMCLKSPSHTKFDQFGSIPKVLLDVSTLTIFLLRQRLEHHTYYHLTQAMSLPAGEDWVLKNATKVAVKHCEKNY